MSVVDVCFAVAIIIGALWLVVREHRKKKGCGSGCESGCPVNDKTP
ncbi:MAG: FeoB-associated Cys-rich membrane protein [bacterium]|nr:FeoB-associated Cys-rich membrane protein [bacterium]